jgi:hypothetical protein
LEAAEVQQGQQRDEEEDDEEDDIDIPEEIETILQALFSCLQDRVIPCPYFLLPS